MCFYRRQQTKTPSTPLPMRALQNGMSRQEIAIPPCQMPVEKLNSMTEMVLITCSAMSFSTLLDRLT